MTIPYVPGIGDVLGKQLPELGSNIAHVINPNIDSQMAARKAIADNPALLQQLATIEKNSPGTLAKIGYGNLASAISGMNLDPGTILQQQTDKAASSVATNPQTAPDVGRVKLGLPTLGAENETLARTGYYKAETGEQVAKTKIAQDQWNKLEAQNNNLKTALSKYPELANVDVADVAKREFDGQPLSDDPAKAAALAIRVHTDPTLATTLHEYLNGIQERAKNAIENNRLDVLKNSSRGEQTVAYKEVLGNLAQAQHQLGVYQAAIAKGAPTTADNAMATSNGPLGDGARQKIALWKEAHSNLADTKAMVEKYQGLSDALLSQLPELKAYYAKANKGVPTTPTTPGTPNSSTPSNAATTSTGNAGAKSPLSILGQQALEAAQSIGVDAIQKKPSWSKLKPTEQQYILKNVPQPSDSGLPSPVTETNNPVTASDSSKIDVVKMARDYLQYGIWPKNLPNDHASLELFSNTVRALRTIGAGANNK